MHTIDRDRKKRSKQIKEKLCNVLEAMEYIRARQQRIAISLSTSRGTCKSSQFATKRFIDIKAHEIQNTNIQASPLDALYFGLPFIFEEQFHMVFVFAFFLFSPEYGLLCRKAQTKICIMIYIWLCVLCKMQLPSSLSYCVRHSMYVRLARVCFRYCLPL